MLISPSHGDEPHKEMSQLALIRANMEGSPGTKPKTLTRLDQKSPTPVPKSAPSFETQSRDIAQEQIQQENISCEFLDIENSFFLYRKSNDRTGNINLVEFKEILITHRILLLPAPFFCMDLSWHKLEPFQDHHRIYVITLSVPYSPSSYICDRNLNFLFEFLNGTR
ncbi:hypothetical protein AVEN_258018-1 [Araneus ventricosus]|uniref:EF-hand domain-containing protein n=1 Tax=Araneus ventricosus TaxID=182803 RepID=A0A4Y2NTC4_ARAVE|nr:hypothetical protein AVEN_258018-1 [Araneus ventricosus]